MDDWLLHSLFQIGVNATLFLLAGIVMIKWSWKKIDAALDSYSKAYHEQKGAIDSRIDRIEKLVQEQARLTRTVESIKDEFAAVAKSRENRWVFRKDVYSTLITTTHDMLRSFHNFADAATSRTDPNNGLRELAMETIKAETPQYAASVKTFTTWASLAPLATADDVLPLLDTASKQVFREINFNSPTAAADIKEQMKPLFTLLKQLQAAGRKDLWGEPEPK